MKSLVGEHRSDGAFDAADAVDHFLAKLDQSSSFTDRFGGDVGRNKFVHRSHTRQLERIVFIGFAFHVFEQPRVLVSAAGDVVDAQFLAKVTDPAAGSASFDHNKVGRSVFEHGSELTALGSDGFKGVIFCVGVVRANH